MSRRVSPRSLQAVAAAVVGVTVIVLVLLVLLSDVHALIVLVALVLVVVALQALRAEQQSRRLLRSEQRTRKRLSSSAAADAEAIEDVAARVERLRKGLVSRRGPGPLRSITKATERLYDQVQAAINLFGMVDVVAPVPPLRGWAVSPDALNLLVQEFLAVRPSLVVECGSGSSTLFLGLVAKKFGVDTRIVALDHDADYAAKTNRLLAAHGVDDIAAARLAPLTDVTTDRAAQPWYDPATLTDLNDIGLLFVDGPPTAIGELARYPVLPVLWDRLAAGASIVLDDTDRAGETEVIALWEQAHPELVGENFRTEKGTYILRVP